MKINFPVIYPISLNPMLQRGVADKKVTALAMTRAKSILEIIKSGIPIAIGIGVTRAGFLFHDTGPPSGIYRVPNLLVEGVSRVGQITQVPLRGI